MKKFRLVMVLGIFYASSAVATECSIQFGGGGKNSAVYSLKNDRVTKSSNLGSPWSFIRYAKGPCRFTLHNKKNYKGNKVQYAELGSRERIASQDGKDKGGWKVRSLSIEPLKTNCKIKLIAHEDLLLGSVRGKVRDAPNHNVFSGPSSFSNISALSGIGKTSGDSSCRFTLYNDNNFAGRQIVVGKVNKPFRGDWRVRSMRITNDANNSSKLVPVKTRKIIKPYKRQKSKG
ncbi:MAG: hypothetical protein KUG78_21290 [Kangiellaceae bacterium]|nr:hypothetical protein [Kangiellaceae bacterium]